jgi:hypothetical protein
MLCDEVRELLYEYIFDELTQDKILEIEQHVKSCTNCKHEYLELRKILLNDMQPFTNAKKNIVMPNDLPVKVKNKLYGIKYKRVSRFTAAACLLIFLFYAVPVAAYYIMENGALNKYIDFDKGLVQEMEGGKIQIVDKSTTMKDITLRVDGVIRKADRTTILLTVKVPKEMDIDYAYPDSGFDTIIVKDQLGKEYKQIGSAGTVRSATKDGEATMILDVEPLKFWTYKLNLRVTALEGGELEKRSQGENVDLSPSDFVMKKNKNIYGCWEVNFYIDRSHKK